MTSYGYYVSCMLVTDKQTTECLRMILCFIMFIRSLFYYSWQSSWDFMEYILFNFSVFEQKDCGKIVLEAA